MSRVLQTGVNQITNSYANHKGWSKGVDVVKRKSQIDNIVAHTAGKVIKVINYMNGRGTLDDEAMGYGNYVMIQHSDKYLGDTVVTLYAHLNNVNSTITKGAIVKQGQILGAMGSTGNSYGGAHLHFEVRLYSSEPDLNNLHNTDSFMWIDPTSFLDTDLPTDPLYRVQTGAYSIKSNAVRQANKLIADGFQAIIKKHGLYYRVQVGAYSVKSNAINMENKLKAKGYKTYITTESGIDVPF